MSALKIAHVADVHLGAGYTHGDEDRGGVNSRLYDFRRAWVHSCGDMVEAGVSLVLFAGDAFRDAKPTPTEEAFFRAGLEILAAAEIPVVAICGNHDLPRQVDRVSALSIFDSAHLGDVTVVLTPSVIIKAGIAIACFPYVMRAHVAALDPEFEHLTIDEQNARIVELSLASMRGLAAQAGQAQAPSVLLAHGTVKGSTIGAEQSTQFLREPVLPLSELRGLPFVYQAWGHLHKAQSLEEHIRYSGSIERCDFAEADEDKGWWEVELFSDPATPNAYTWHSSEPRPFVDLELEDPSDWQGCLAGIPECMTMDAIVRVKYIATPEVAKTVDHAAIRRMLYGAGAVKVHGPIATITHAVADKADGITEDTDTLTGWHRWADLQGLSGPQRERLDRKVGEQLEAICQA